jgi:hypothetical protein
VPVAISHNLTPPCRSREACPIPCDTGAGTHVANSPEISRNNYGTRLRTEYTEVLAMVPRNNKQIVPKHRNIA